MAENDASIKLTLDASSAIKEARKAGPEIEKALNVQIRIDKNSSQSEKFLKTQQNQLRQNVETLAEYDAKLDPIIAKYQKLTELKEKAPGELSSSQKGALTAQANNKNGRYSAEVSQKAKETLANYREADKLEKEIVADISKLGKTPEELLGMANETEVLANRILAGEKKIAEEKAETAKKQSELTAKAKATSQEEKKTADASKETAKATADAKKAAEQTADAAKKATQAKKETTSATKEAIEAEKKLGEESAKTESKKKGSTTASSKKSKKTEDIPTDTADSEKRINAIKSLVSEINTLKGAGEDTTKQMQELQTLLGVDLNSQSIADLTRMFIDLDETIKFIKNDLQMSDILDTEFKALFDSLVLVQQKINDIKKDIRGSKEIVDPIEEINNKIAGVNDTIAKIPQMKFDTAADAKRNLDELKAAQKAIVDMGMPLALSEQYNQLDAAIKNGTQAQKDFNKAASEKSSGDDSKLNWLRAFVLTTQQAELEFQNAMQGVIDTTDRVENAMRFDEINGTKDNIAELIRRLNELKEAKKTLEDYGLPREMDNRYALLISLIEQTTQQIKNYGKSVEDTASSSKKAGEASKKMVKDTSSGLSGISTLINTTKKGFSSLSKIADKTKSSFDGMARNMKSNFKHMLTNITKYVFGFRSLFFLVRRVRKYIGEGIQSMAKFSDGHNSVNSNISKLITSLEYLKNAWATAFDPILQFVTPMLTYLLDKLASVGNAFSRFLGNLLGASKVFQAVKGPTKNYAKSLDKAGKGAGGAAKKQKELNDRLADFDVLHVLGKDNANKGSGGGSGSGNDDEDKKRNNKLWDFAKVGKNLKKMIQEMWKEADFTKLGEKLASGLRSAFENLNKKMPEILTVANKVGKSIATFLNGLFSDPWLFIEMGKAAANLGNVLVQALAGFFEKYKPGKIGSSIADFLRGVFQNFDWKTAGENLGNFVSTFFTELATLFENFPVEDFLKGLEAFFEGIDWASVVKSLFDFFAGSAGLIGKILAGLGDMMSQISSDDIIETFSKVDWAKVADGFGTLIAGLIYSSLAGINLAVAIVKAILEAIGGEELKKGMEEGDFAKAGKALIDGLAKGIGEAFNNAVNWTADYIVKPIVEGFKTLFKIHSPSEVTAEWGMFLIEGLANGLSDNIKKITAVWENIQTVITTIWDNIKLLVLTSATTFHDNVVKVFEGLKDALKGPAQGILNVAGGIANGIIKALNAGINAINKFLGKIEFPDWLSKIPGVSFLAGKKVDFGLKTLSTVQVPKLAQGAVIPPNREFMAVLGDQSHGTNIEAPLDTIKQAVAEVMANNGNAEMIQLLQQLIAVVESKNLVIGDKEIGKANARYANKQRIIRGTSF